MPTLTFPPSGAGRRLVRHGPTPISRILPLTHVPQRRLSRSTERITSSPSSASATRVSILMMPSARSPMRRVSTSSGLSTASLEEKTLTSSSPTTLASGQTSRLTRMSSRTLSSSSSAPPSTPISRTRSVQSTGRVASTALAFLPSPSSTPPLRTCATSWLKSGRARTSHLAHPTFHPGLATRSWSSSTPCRTLSSP